MLIRQYVIDLFFRHKDPAKPLPSEHELARKFGVSRTTIRLALDDLVRNGYLVRRNRSGNYLSPDYEIPTSGQYKKILFLIGDGKYVFYSGNMLGICSRIFDYFSRREYRFVPVNLNDDSSPADELSFYRPDGILWIQPDPALSSGIRECAERFPLQVLFGYDNSLPNSSCVDYACGAELAAAYFRKKGIAAPFLVGAGNSPIRKPFTDTWKSIYGSERIFTIMQSGRKNLTEKFRRIVPEGIFCFSSELSELKAALSSLPEYTMTDTDAAGIRPVLDLYPAGEISYACRALEKLMRRHSEPKDCRIIRPVLRSADTGF